MENVKAYRSRNLNHPKDVIFGVAIGNSAYEYTSVQMLTRSTGTIRKIPSGEAPGICLSLEAKGSHRASVLH